jgi:hypothetical protein
MLETQHEEDNKVCRLSGTTFTFMTTTSLMMSLRSANGSCLDWVGWEFEYQKVRYVHGASYYLRVGRSGIFRHLGRLSDEDLISMFAHEMAFSTLSSWYIESQGKILLASDHNIAHFFRLCPNRSESSSD